MIPTPKCWFIVSTIIIIIISIAIAIIVVIVIYVSLGMVNEDLPNILKLKER